ncbi:hypothetical protein NPIL_507091 [Nephila pilipes]|uniref:Uncharacterized protein n=1 Tax=Nephila pilipes TaxID=299642 RepID=A0A8X6NKM0_NEPPI|nr:hypothetical protein NPIL_507091 [Nephila pilipes]
MIFYFQEHTYKHQNSEKVQQSVELFRAHSATTDGGYKRWAVLLTLRPSSFSLLSISSAMAISSFHLRLFDHLLEHPWRDRGKAHHRRLFPN